MKGQDKRGSAAVPTGSRVVAGQHDGVSRVGPLEAGMSDSPSATVSPGRKSQAVSHRTGHLPDEGCAGASHLRRQGQESAQPRQLVLSQDRQRRPPDLRLDRRGRRHRVPGRRQRGRRASRWKRGWSRTFSPSTTATSRTTSRFPYLQITTGEDFPRVNFTRQPLDQRRQAVRPVPAGQEPARGDPGARSGSSSSGPVRSTSRKTTRAGSGFARACSRRSTSARPRATCGSIARATAATSGVSNCSSTARKTFCSRKWKRRCANRARPSSSRRRPGCAMRSRHSARSTCGAIWPIMLSPRCFMSIRARA